MKMSGQEQMEAWGFQDPDMVGSSEYLAIFDCLATLAEGCAEQVADDGGDLRDFVAGCAGELVSWAIEFQQKLEQLQKSA